VSYCHFNTFTYTVYRLAGHKDEVEMLEL